MLDVMDMGDQAWDGDDRFHVPSPKVNFKCYQDVVSESQTKVRFLTQTRERYLRREFSDVFSGALAETGGTRRAQALAEASHVLIPDTAFARDYIEFIEGTEVEALLLGSVLDALRTGARSNREFNRLRQCMAKPTRAMSVFHNQYFVCTDVARQHGQAREDHDAACLCAAVAWLCTQPCMSGLRCVLVSDYAVLLRHATQAGLTTDGSGNTAAAIATLSSESYFKQYWGRSPSVQTLVESVVQALEAREAEAAELAAAEQAMGETGFTRKTRQRRWMSDEDLSLALQAGTLLQGQLQVDEHRPEEAWVRVSKDSTRQDAVDIFLPTRAHRGRSIHGDMVAVSELPREEWRCPSYQLARRSASEEGAEKVDGTSSILQAQDRGKVVPTGRVVGVLASADRCCVATIEDDVSAIREGTTAAVLALPMDMRLPKLRLRTRRARALGGCRLVLAIDEWSIDSTYPACHLIRVLGPSGGVDVESEAILVECNLSGSHSLTYDAPSLKPLWAHLPRPLGGARPFAFEFGPGDHVQRRDLRQSHHGIIMSIDPPGCVDIDDALSLKVLPNGRVELGVHIADVTHYVAAGSALDQEARGRSTTVYLVDRRLDMLPALLSTNLCSLRGNEDRCAVSVLWEFEQVSGVGWVADPEKIWFGRTMINSVWEGSYQVAQAVIDGNTTTGKYAAEAQRVFSKLPGGLPAAQQQLRAMLGLAMDIRRQRALRGALELHSSEVDFDLVRPAGTAAVGEAAGKAATAGTEVGAKSVMPHESLPVMDMVAELMILANSAVAKQIYTAFPSAGCLRRHPLPRSERFDELVKTAALQGLTLDPSSNAALAASLAEAERAAPPAVAVLLKTMATRAMTEAEYFCTGDFASPEDFYHYGLAAEFYTHFTSPIRRYADVVVHRLLLRSLLVDDPAATTPASAGGAATSGSTKAMSLLRTNSATPSLSDQCRHMNAQHRMAKAASERSQQLFFSVFFRGQGRTVVEAVIAAVRANGVVVFVPEYEVQGNVYLRSKDGGSAFMPLEDNSTDDAVPDPSVRLDFENGEGHGGRKRLIATAEAGGTVRWAVEVFDRILVSIVSEQTKYHLPGLKISFVGTVGSSGRGPSSKYNTAKDLSAPPKKGTKASKATLGSLRDAIAEEQAAKEARMAEVKQTALSAARIKAGLPPAPPPSHRRDQHGQRQLNFESTDSLYTRLRLAQPVQSTGTSVIDAGHLSAEAGIQLNGSVCGRTSPVVPSGRRLSRADLPAKRKIGGRMKQGHVVTLREQGADASRSRGRGATTTPTSTDASSSEDAADNGGGGGGGRAQTIASVALPQQMEAIPSVDADLFPQLATASAPREPVPTKRPESTPILRRPARKIFTTTAEQRAMYCRTSRLPSLLATTEPLIKAAKDSTGGSGYHSKVATGPRHGQGFAMQRTVMDTPEWELQLGLALSKAEAEEKRVLSAGVLPLKQSTAAAAAAGGGGGGGSSSSPLSWRSARATAPLLAHGENEQHADEPAIEDEDEDKDGGLEDFLDTALEDEDSMPGRVDMSGTVQASVSVSLGPKTTARTPAPAPAPAPAPLPVPFNDDDDDDLESFLDSVI